MQEFIRFALLGFGIGALYALASQGLMVIYRGSGVLNFALGRHRHGRRLRRVGADRQRTAGRSCRPRCRRRRSCRRAIGALTHLLIMRPLRTASPLVRVIATLGVLITLQAIAVLRYGSTPDVRRRASCRRTSWHDLRRHRHLGRPAASCSASPPSLTRRAVGAVPLHAVRPGHERGGRERARRRRRSAGRPTASPRSTGRSAAALAGLAAILIAPIVTLQVAVMTNLVLAATAAALVAGVPLVPGRVRRRRAHRHRADGARTATSSSPGFGAVGAVPRHRRRAGGPRPGAAAARLLPAAAAVRRQRARSTGRGTAFGVARRRAPVRRARPGSGRTRSSSRSPSAVVLLSIVVVTGYAGQLSLAQFALAGFGAWVAGRLVAPQGMPFWLALLVGVAGRRPVGVLFALPGGAHARHQPRDRHARPGHGDRAHALPQQRRTRAGSRAPRSATPSLFGVDINAIAHPTRYGLVALALLRALRARRSPTCGAGASAGGCSRCARTSARPRRSASASPGAKLYAFGAVGRHRRARRHPARVPQGHHRLRVEFTNFTSILAVGCALIGGIGYLIGPDRRRDACTAARSAPSSLDAIFGDVDEVHRS